MHTPFDSRQPETQTCYHPLLPRWEVGSRDLLRNEALHTSTDKSQQNVNTQKRPCVPRIWKRYDTGGRQKNWECESQYHRHTFLKYTMRIYLGRSRTFTRETTTTPLEPPEAMARVSGVITFFACRSQCGAQRHTTAPPRVHVCRHAVVFRHSFPTLCASFGIFFGSTLLCVLAGGPGHVNEETTHEPPDGNIVVKLCVDLQKSTLCYKQDKPNGCNTGTTGTTGHLRRVFSGKDVRLVNCANLDPLLHKLEDGKKIWNTYDPNK